MSKKIKFYFLFPLITGIIFTFISLIYKTDVYIIFVEDGHLPAWGWPLPFIIDGLNTESHMGRLNLLYDSPEFGSFFINIVFYSMFVDLVLRITKSIKTKYFLKISDSQINNK